MDGVFSGIGNMDLLVHVHVLARSLHMNETNEITHQ
jgi:hypothetical protein